MFGFKLSVETDVRGNLSTTLSGSKNTASEVTTNVCWSCDLIEEAVPFVTLHLPEMCLVS